MRTYCFVFSFSSCHIALYSLAPSRLVVRGLDLFQDYHRQAFLRDLDSGMTFLTCTFVWWYLWFCLEKGNECTGVSWSVSIVSLSSVSKWVWFCHIHDTKTSKPSELSPTFRPASRPRSPLPAPAQPSPAVALSPCASWAESISLKASQRVFLSHQ